MRFRSVHFFVLILFGHILAYTLRDDWNSSAFLGLENQPVQVCSEEPALERQSYFVRAVCSSPGNTECTKACPSCFDSAANWNADLIAFQARSFFLLNLHDPFTNQQILQIALRHRCVPFSDDDLTV